MGTFLGICHDGSSLLWWVRDVVGTITPYPYIGVVSMYSYMSALGAPSHNIDRIGRPPDIWGIINNQSADRPLYVSGGSVPCPYRLSPR